MSEVRKTYISQDVYEDKQSANELAQHVRFQSINDFIAN